MPRDLLASFQVDGFDEHGEIYRKAFRPPSGLVFAQPAAVPCQYCPMPGLQVDQRCITQCQLAASFEIDPYRFCMV
jgi:hypothetical protein